MDFGQMLDESFAYAKGSVWGKWSQWLLLLVSLIIFPFILGYIVRIYRGEKQAPELKLWGSMFFDGLKLLIVQIIYALPVILLIIAAFLPLVSTLVTSGSFHVNFARMSDAQVEQWFISHPEFISAAGLMIVFLLLAVIFAIFITIFSFIGTVRFARTARISEAFNFSAILAQIGRIGWINYIVALLIITIIGFIFSMIPNIISFIPVIGSFIGLVVMVVLCVPFVVFTSRYAALVYESGEETVSPVPEGQTPVI
ncbi:MAG: DUF4013 domain-containing protein [Methanomicrobiales archaeon]|nr:DUF4013 domain-containing protein [Methanomicrobiales archaeon]